MRIYMLYRNDLLSLLLVGTSGFRNSVMMGIADQISPCNSKLGKIRASSGLTKPNMDWEEIVIITELLRNKLCWKHP